MVKIKVILSLSIILVAVTIAAIYFFLKNKVNSDFLNNFKGLKELYFSIDNTTNNVSYSINTRFTYTNDTYFSENIEFNPDLLYEVCVPNGSTENYIRWLYTFYDCRNMNFHEMNETLKDFSSHIFDLIRVKSEINAENVFEIQKKNDIYVDLDGISVYQNLAHDRFSIQLWYNSSEYKSSIIYYSMPYSGKSREDYYEIDFNYHLFNQFAKTFLDYGKVCQKQATNCTMSYSDSSKTWIDCLEPH